jgi:hypothetical protein
VHEKASFFVFFFSCETQFAPQEQTKQSMNIMTLTQFYLISNQDLGPSPQKTGIPSYATTNLVM